MSEQGIILWNDAQVAEILGLSKYTVRDKRLAGEIKSVRVAANRYRMKPEHVEEYLKTMNKPQAKRND